MKTSNPIADLFGRSPFRPMQEHMQVVSECIDCIPELFDALIANDQSALERACETIFAHERNADQIKNRVRLHLPRSLFMPVDRRDLLALLEAQDMIADTTKGIAKLLSQRAMPAPQSMQELLRALLDCSIDACRQAAAIVDELDELIETGFRGPEATRVEHMIRTLGETESDSDRQALALNQLLFAQEDALSPVTVMLWHQLIERIGNLADHAERVGERVLLLIAR